MSNPLRQLKFLPWLPLVQVAIFAVATITVLDFLLQIGYVYVPLIRTTLEFLYSPPLNLFMAVAIAAGLGMLAVYLLEILQGRVIINAGVLWALILCVMVALLLNSLLGLPDFLASPDQTSLIGVVLGVFSRGRRYWR